MGKKHFKFDPEFLQALEANPDENQLLPEFSSALDLRKHLETEFQARAADVAQVAADVTVSSSNPIPTNPELKIYSFTPKSVEAKKDSARSPAVIYVHGGGFVAGNIGRHFTVPISKLASDAGVVIFAPEYRLAPEHPCPAAIDDVLDCYRWVTENAESLHVDRFRVALMGASAGGTIATAAALFWGREGASNGPRIAKLVLVSPMFDDRTALHPEDWMNPIHTWTSNANTVAWRAYLGADSETGVRSGMDLSSLSGRISAYANLPTRAWSADWEPAQPEASGDDDQTVKREVGVPGRLRDLHTLPRTYVEVGGADLFKDECLHFVEKLVDGNVEVEFHLWPGVPHGFTGRAPHIRLSKLSREHQLKALAGI